MTKSGLKSISFFPRAGNSRGLGIGGAHLIAACRRNLDLTLLVLNNFNFGMTGGQCSATPTDAVPGSAFPNRLERPLEVEALVKAAGASFVCRCSAYQPDLAGVLEQAISFRGFSVVEHRDYAPVDTPNLTGSRPMT